MGSGLQASVPSTSGQNTLGSCRPGMRLDQHTPAGCRIELSALTKKGSQERPGIATRCLSRKRRRIEGLFFSLRKIADPMQIHFLFGLPPILHKLAETPKAVTPIRVIPDQRRETRG